MRNACLHRASHFCSFFSQVLHFLIVLVSTLPVGHRIRHPFLALRVGFVFVPSFFLQFWAHIGLCGGVGGKGTQPVGVILLLSFFFKSKLQTFLHLPSLHIKWLVNSHIVALASAVFATVEQLDNFWF